MPLFLQHKDSTCLWGVWKMEETYEDLCTLLPSSLLLEAEQRFSALHRKQEWLSVRALLRELTGKKLEIAYYPSGKPYLLDSSISISISHTRGYVAVILGEKNVGIDIEQYGPRVHKVAERFMRPDEVALPFDGEDTWSLLLHWSAKETMFKCMNADAVDFQEHLQILPFMPARRGIFQAHEYKTKERRRFFIHYLLHSDFVLTWSVE